MSKSLREIAELYLYDGDTDQPLTDYLTLHDLADRLDASVCVPLDGLADKIEAAVDTEIEDSTGERGHIRDFDYLPERIAKRVEALLQSLAVAS